MTAVKALQQSGSAAGAQSSPDKVPGATANPGAARRRSSRCATARVPTAYFTSPAVTASHFAGPKLRCWRLVAKPGRGAIAVTVERPTAHGGWGGDVNLFAGLLRSNHVSPTWDSRAAGLSRRKWYRRWCFQLTTGPASVAHSGLHRAIGQSACRR